MFRPYLRMRPALCVQTRLEETHISAPPVHTLFPRLLHQDSHSPLAGTLAVGARARVPDRFVRHIGGFASWMSSGEEELLEYLLEGSGETR